ncbi:thermonuclease family protein [Brevundimonas sp. TWP2-3-4b1]|uniref:thermonuclease family protein n=1 Tax=Brevundimonas sp. TWP2-3-4b1 TaxID=2804580 RepID=UPI003CE9A6B2
MAAPITLTRSGTDRYGRTLAKVTTFDGTDVGTEMISRGVADPWTGRQTDWCGAVTDVAAGAGLLRAKPSPLTMLSETTEVP